MLNRRQFFKRAAVTVPGVALGIATIKIPDAQPFIPPIGKSGCYNDILAILNETNPILHDIKWNTCPAKRTITKGLPAPQWRKLSSGV